MKKSVLFTIALTALMVIPAVALAQNFTYVNNWLNQALYWLRLAITVVMIAMTLFFLWTVFQFISAKDPAKAKEKRELMINGIIGLFVSVAVWGIIRIAGSVLGVDVNNIDRTPAVTCPPGMFYSRATGTCVVG
ncbi:MAG: hypothetical protein ACOYMZ_00075 [Minisyncoccia bacterium]